ncbi:MAG: DUF4276 family protein [Thermoflexales bacterium]|nr:DUF4276 family protein [Thermoflexales bacterium]
MEEESMGAFLEGFLPRFFPAITYELHPLGGKGNMLQKIPGRLKGYASWLPENWCIVILIDQNSQDCHRLKAQLEEFAQTAGLPTVTHPRGEAARVINRIVMHSLEAWYFGDWDAVCQAYPRAPRDIPRRARYRNPDAIPNPAQNFEHVMQQVGYFKTGLRKIEAAREIGRYLEADRNTSHSFQVFYRALKTILG